MGLQRREWATRLQSAHCWFRLRDSEESGLGRGSVPRRRMLPQSRRAQKGKERIARHDLPWPVGHVSPPVGSLALRALMDWERETRYGRALQMCFRRMAELPNLAQ